MRIGIDIDNVISNFNEVLLKEYIEHDKELRGTGVINEDEYIDTGMFDWSKEENDSFYYKNIQRIAMSLIPLKDSKEVIDKLKSDGNEIFIISSRDNGEYTNPQKMTSDWLKKYNIYYDKLILTDKHQKGKVCKENSIDIMIDDSINNCEDVENNGIKCFLMETRFNINETKFEKVKDWEDIYSKITAMYEKEISEKINVILDTDTYNECDDQFALAYLLKHRNKFNVEAITIAPFQNRWIPSDDSGIELSYQEAKRVCELSGIDSENFIFKGSTNFISKGYTETNEAVNKIIEIALKNKKTYILGIGAITNIALAIKQEPKIIDRIEIIWLGGHTLLSKNNLHEANFKDIDAVRIIYESNVKLTVIPCRGVASNLYTSIYELEKYIKGKSKLCDFLYARFEEVVNKREILPRWRLWDIAVIAYMVNKDWFETFQTSCPDINDDTSYSFNLNNREITMVNYFDACQIYNDLFNKLGE